MALVERLSATNPTPIRDNPWWYSNGNIYYAMGSSHQYGMPNCTCYCYGRTAEIDGAFNTNLPAANAGNWYARVESAGIIPVGYEPLLGGIMVFRDKPDATVHNAGHVATVERINADGSVITSNSGYQSTYFWRETLRPENGYLSSWMENERHDYMYVGCIYTYEQPAPPPPTKRKHMPVWMMLRYHV